ncbi:MAG TPA: ABC transporter permease, partial [Actinocrinis sp.]|nr:ABC transporter permease [Actinocrinis sp.]
MSTLTTQPNTAPGPGPAPARTALRHRLAERGVDRTLLLLLPGVVAVIALFFYPFIYGLGLSFQPQGTNAGHGVFASYRSFFSDSFARGSIGTTFYLAIPAALINVGFAVPISYRMRTDFRGK